MSTVTVMDIPQLDDPKVAKIVRDGIKDISDLMTIMDGYKIKISDAKKALAEDNDIPKKSINWLAKTYYKQSLQSVVAETDANAEAYTKVFGDD